MFLEEPGLKIGKKPEEFILISPLRYKSLLIEDVIEVPEGFATDLASIPRGFRNVVPKNGRHRLASIVHDYLYAKKGKINQKVIKRSLADKIFFEAMKISGVPIWKRHIMYRAVRMAGWTFWNY